MKFQKGNNLGGRTVGSRNKKKEIYKGLYEDIVGSFKSGECYVYYHIDTLSLETVYIGKGTGNRAWDFKDSSRNNIWLKYKNENELKVRVIAANLSNEEALSVESALIKVINPILNLLMPEQE